MSGLVGIISVVPGDFVFTRGGLTDFAPMSIYRADSSLACAVDSARGGEDFDDNGCGVVPPGVDQRLLNKPVGGVVFGLG